MQHPKLFSLVIILACLLLGCSGNNATNSDKDSTSVSNSSAAASGNDYYYELTTNTSGKNLSITGITKMFVSAKGDMRMEMQIHNSANGDKASAPIILIAHADKPGESIGIDDSAKTYTVNHFDSADLNTGFKTQSTASKIGEEKILGFNCVHARIISNKKMGSFFDETDTVDLWKSNEVPMQPSVKKLMDQFESRTGNTMYSPETAAQLKQMGCDGFMVKMQMGNKNTAVIMQLTKVERKDFPSGMFEIPAGYKENKSGM
ncbi:MAG TPA: DUF4412 domain-containing protein [Ginsengibacter sp.]